MDKTSSFKLEIFQMSASYVYRDTPKHKISSGSLKWKIAKENKSNKQTNKKENKSGNTILKAIVQYWDNIDFE